MLLFCLTGHLTSAQGVCTSWLAGLRPGGERVPVWVQAGVLRLPADPALPLLLVGPGHGCRAVQVLRGGSGRPTLDAGGQHGNVLFAKPVSYAAECCSPWTSGLS